MLLPPCCCQGQLVEALTSSNHWAFSVFARQSSFSMGSSASLSLPWSCQMTGLPSFASKMLPLSSHSFPPPLASPQGKSVCFLESCVPASSLFPLLPALAPTTQAPHDRWNELSNSKLDYTHNQCADKCLLGGSIFVSVIQFYWYKECIAYSLPKNNKIHFLQ